MAFGLLVLRVLLILKSVASADDNTGISVHGVQVAPFQAPLPGGAKVQNVLGLMKPRASCAMCRFKLRLVPSKQWLLI
jgi:hypothetical protein